MASQNLMYIGWSPVQIILLLLLVVVFFGKGKVSDLMGDVAKGIKSFKKGLAEDDTPPAQPATPPKPLEHDPVLKDAKVSTGTENKA